MSHNILIPFIFKISVLGYFPYNVRFYIEYNNYLQNILLLKIDRLKMVNVASCRIS